MAPIANSRKLRHRTAVAHWPLETHHSASKETPPRHHPLCPGRVSMQVEILSRRSYCMLQKPEDASAIMETVLEAQPTVHRTAPFATKTYPAPGVDSSSLEARLCVWGAELICEEEKLVSEIAEGDFMWS